MKVLVTYLSQTGGTKKVAEAIFDGIQADKDMKPIGEVQGLADYDLVFLGFPIQQFGPAAEAKAFLQNQCAGKKLALFVTHGALEGQDGLAEWLGKCSEAAACAEVVDMFDCQAEVAQPVIDFLAANPNPQLQAFAAQGKTTKGQPDAGRLEKARLFAQETMAKAN
jgi:flavodoxin I